MSQYFPEGVKYSFFAVQAGLVLVGYDNHRPKGHHRHFLGKEESYVFSDFDELGSDFKKDLETALKARKDSHGVKNDSY